MAWVARAFAQVDLPGFVVAHQDPVEGGAGTAYLGYLHLGVLEAIEVLAPVGKEHDLIVFDSQGMDDHEGRWLELVDQLHGVLLYHHSDVGGFPVEGAAGFCI